MQNLEIYEWFGVKEITKNLPTKTVDKLQEGIKKTLFESGWAAISGRIGSGKTTSVYDAIENISKEYPIEVIEPKVLNRKIIDVPHLLNPFIDTLGEKYSNNSIKRRNIDARTLQVEGLLMKTKAANVIPVLLIDEAQEMASQTLNMIKRLRDVTFVKKAIMLPVILLGQPGLFSLLENNEECRYRINWWQQFGYSKKELIAITQYRSHNLLSEDAARQAVELYTEKEFGESTLPTPLRLDSEIRKAMKRAFDVESKSLSISHFVPPANKVLPKAKPRPTISIVEGDAEKTEEEIKGRAAG